MGRRRSSTGVTDFLSDLTDDVKDFVDDEIIDRGRDTERDLRRASRNLTRDEARDRRDSRRDSRRGGSREDELDELRRAVRSLARKVNALADNGSTSGSGSTSDTDTSDLPIANYDSLTVADIGDRLPSLTQAELEAVDAYEQANANRSTLTSRIEVLRGPEPWSGYDELTVPDVRKKLADADEALADEVRAYETRHKNRQGVLDAVASAKSG